MPRSVNYIYKRKKICSTEFAVAKWGRGMGDDSQGLRIMVYFHI